MGTVLCMVGELFYISDETVKSQQNLYFFVKISNNYQNLPIFLIIFLFLNQSDIGLVGSGSMCATN